MKFIHLSDLHIGKRVNEFSMLEDQRYIFEQILDFLRKNPVDGVLLAGDIYDKSIPSAEAVQLFDWFLTSLAEQGLFLFLIGGNHDSQERLSFGAQLMERRGIYIAPVFSGHITSVSIRDSYGEVEIYLVPFLKPATVRRYFPEQTIETYADALRAVLGTLSPDLGKRNVCVAHQFVTGAVSCESEELAIGGVEQIPAELFDGFDYVALGHLHGPQSVKRETIRYCGTPLKYSFSEAGHEKSLTLVELEEKGRIQIQTIPLIPKRDLQEIRGTYLEVTARSFYEDKKRENYYHITLTDEADIPDAVAKLRVIYPNLMKLTYDNQRTRASQQLEPAKAVEEKTPMELLTDFYELQNNQPMTREQKNLAARLMESIWEVS